MKFSEGNLRVFLEFLPEYRELSEYARSSFFAIKDPFGSFSAFLLHPELEKTGFFKKNPDGRNRTVVPARREFVKVLQAWDKLTIFEQPNRTSFMTYFGDMRGTNRPLKFEEVTSPQWVESFLESNGVDWERPYQDPQSPPLFADGQTVAILKSIVRFLITQGAPRSISELPGSWSTAELAAALYGGLRYGILFPGVDLEEREPHVGLWPQISIELLKAHAKAPEPVAATDSFTSPFLVEDCTALLIACAAEPFRLKDTGELYAKNIRDLAKQLKPLPKWVEDPLDVDAELRVIVASSYARTFGFLEYAPTQPAQLRITVRGKAWLELAAGDRWRVIVDGIWDRKQSVPGFSQLEKTRIGALLYDLQVRSTLKRLPDFVEELLWVTRALKGDHFYSITDIITHASVTKNPLQEIALSDKRATAFFRGRNLQLTDPAEVRNAWSAILWGFFIQRLLPTGGVRLGRLESGLAIALTPAGRYFISQTHEWPVADAIGGQVIVQPNFEVTFLGESPLAESEISRFAERRGAGMGAMFQITKKSIFAAAVAGLTPEKVLATLDKVCSREVPPNVRREITGWFAQSRSVTFEVAVLIRCQDRETAMKVLGLAKGHTSILNDTVVEYKGTNQQRAVLTRKLKEAGIRVSLPESLRG